MNLTRQVAIDYAKDKIHCNALCPGCQFIQPTGFHTEAANELIKGSVTMTAQSLKNYEDETFHAEVMAATPWHEWASPTDIAKAALFLASDDASFVTGIGLPVDGGFTA